VNWWLYTIDILERHQSVVITCVVLYIYIQTHTHTHTHIYIYIVLQTYIQTYIHIVYNSKHVCNL